MPDQRHNTGSGLAALAGDDVYAALGEMERLLRHHDNLPAEQKGEALAYLVVDLDEQVSALRRALR